MIKRKEIMQKTWFLILVIVVVGGITHSSIFNNPFKTLDDQASILNNEHIKSFSHVKDIFTSSFFGGKSYYRPLVSLSFMLNYGMSQENPLSYNVTNLILHLLSGLVIFLLLKKKFLSQNSSFYAALLFVIHPIHWEAVSNIPGRSILLSALFSLSAFYFFILSRERPKRIFWYGSSLACFILSMLSKESGCMLPAVLSAYVIFLGEPKEKKEQIFFLVPYFVLVGGYVVLRKALGVTQIFYWPSVKMHFLGVMTFLRSIFTDLRMFVFPVDLHFDRSRILFTRFDSKELWATMLLFVFIGIWMIKDRKKISPLVWFLIFWFFIELFPVSQIIGSIGVNPGYISTAEHFLYVSSVSVFVLLVLWAQNIFAWNRQRNMMAQNSLKLVFLGIFLLFSLVTFEQELYSSQEFSMLERTLMYDPHNTRIRMSLALGFAEKGLFEEAENHFRQVVEEDPQDIRAQIGLAKSLCDQGKYFEGMSLYESIQNPRAFTDLLEGNLQATYDQVIRFYRKKMEEERDNAGWYYSLGVIYAKKGELGKALLLYEQALVIDPEYREALFNLAAGYEVYKKWDKSIELYNRLIRLEDDGDDLTQIAKTRLKEITQLRNSKQ